jgi:hypothetical protein
MDNEIIKLFESIELSASKTKLTTIVKLPVMNINNHNEVVCGKDLYEVVDYLNQENNFDYLLNAFDCDVIEIDIMTDDINLELVFYTNNDISVIDLFDFLSRLDVTLSLIDVGSDNQKSLLVNKNNILVKKINNKI